MKIKDFFMAAVFEYSIALLFLLYMLTYDTLGLPSITNLLMLAERGFAAYGLLFLFVGLLLEGLFVVGLYFPGSAIVFGSVIFWAATPIDLLAVVGIGSVTLVVASALNYLIGRHGYYKLFKKMGAQKTIDRMERRFQKGYKPTLVVFSSSPNFLAIASVYAGVANIPLKKYLLFVFVCTLFWVSLVAAIIFFFVSPESLYGADNLGLIVFVILLAWALFESVVTYIQEKKRI